MDDLNDFLSKSLAMLEKQEKKSRRRLSSLSIDKNLKKPKKPIATKAEIPNDQKIVLNFSNTISEETLYTPLYERKANLSKHNDNLVKQSLSPFFPSEQIYSNEINDSKNFLLDKYINQNKQEKASRKKKIVSDKYSDIIDNLSKENLKYTELLPLTGMWLKYIKELILTDQNTKLTSVYLKKNQDGIYHKFLKCDYHGAYCVVHDSTNKNIIGVCGIVILETKNVFFILDIANRLKMILKKGSIFKFPLIDTYSSIGLTEEDMNVYINGDGFLYKATERTKAKFKTKI